MTKNEVIRGLLDMITADGVPEKQKKIIAEAVALLSEEKEISTGPVYPYYPYCPTPNITPCPSWNKGVITC